MKLICAGLPKTGSKSIAQALRVLGYSVWDFDEQVLNYTDEWLDLYEHGKVPDFYAMFKDVDAVIDDPCTFFFEELMEAFPDAKVILSEREENAWIQSYINHDSVWKSSHLMKMMLLIPTFRKLWNLIVFFRMAKLGSHDPKSTFIYRKRYRWHTDERVKSVVPQDKLLVYSVQQGWQPLCKFTGNKIPDQPFPHANVKGELVHTFLIETELGRKIAREVKMVKVCFVAVVVALTGVALMYFLDYF